MASRTIHLIQQQGKDSVCVTTIFQAAAQIGINRYVFWRYWKKHNKWDIDGNKVSEINLIKVDTKPKRKRI